MKEGNVQFFEKVDEILALFGMIFSIILAVYVTTNIGRLIYTLTAILTFFSCLIWLYLKKNASPYFKQSQYYSANIVFLSMIVILFTLSILSIRYRFELYERPLSYFILNSLMAGVLVLEILYFNKRAYPLILVQIIIIGTSLAWSQLLIFPSLLGVDPWWHQMFTSEIIGNSHIPENQLYSKLPIFHLLIASTSLVSNFDYKVATMFSISLIQIICNVLFVFLIGKFLFGDYKIGLLASLLLVVSNHHIFMSYWSIPNSLAAVYIAPIYYIGMKIKKNCSIAGTILSMILMVTLILTHTVAAMCMAIILFIYWIGFNYCNRFYFKRKIPVTSIYLILFNVVMFAWWSFASGHIYNLANLIKWGFSRDVFDSTPDEILVKATEIISLQEELFTNIGMFLFFALSFVGLFYMISKKYGTHDTFSMAFVGATPLVLGFSSLISQHSIIEHRWWYFAQILLSLPLALSLLLLSNIAKSKYSKHMLLVVLTVLLTFFLIMSPAANVDNHIFTPNSNRVAFTESEMHALSTISVKYGGTIGVDKSYSVLDFLPLKADLHPIDYELYTGNFKNSNSKYILIRNYIETNSFKLYKTGYRLTYNPHKKLEEQGYSRIYDCKSVRLFTD